MTGLLFGEQGYASGLNARQREAVEHSDGPLIVLAGPGTGKTRVIVHRVARLLEVGAGRGPVDPERVLAVTFTIKAAAEMRERLHTLVGASAAERVHVRTFHGFGRWVLRRFGDVLGVRPSWRIMDSAERKRLMRSVVHDEGLLDDADAAAGPEAFVADALRFVESCGHQGVSPQECVSEAKRRLAAAPREDNDASRAVMALADRFARRVRAYEVFSRRCIRGGTLTFEDLIALPIALLADPRIGSIVRQDIRHVVVDEFQDVNPAQIRLLRLLAPPADPAAGAASGEPDLCVVGDDDQAIYAFRGTSERSFEHFRAVWGGAGGSTSGGLGTPSRVRTIALEENYRSDPAVLRAAGVVIAGAASRFAPDKVLKASRPPAGIGVRAVEGVLLDDDDEAGVAIAAEIEHWRRAGGEERSIAVIARTHTALGRIAEELALQGVPTVYTGRPDAGGDAGVADLLAWIEAINDPSAIGPVQRLLSRPPMRLAAPALAHVIRHEQAARSRARAFGAGATPGASRPDGATDPLAWLELAATGAGLDPLESQAVAGYIALHRSLSHAAVTSPAHEVVRRIIADAGLAEADALEGRARSKRVRALITFLQFARSRADRFDQPGRLAELWSYYRDLSEEEQRTLCDGSPGEQPLDVDDALEHRAEEAEPAPPGAVTLLTAHACKGLEFDGVFGVNVRPGGFPDRARSDDDDELLPRDWLERLAQADGLAPLDRVAAVADEQRRLFYVVCTRARRRLVLLAKHKKTKGGAADYFIELQGAADAIPMTVRTVAEVQAEARAQGAAHDADGEVDDLTRAVDAGGGASPQVRVGARARERSRRTLARLIAELQSPGRAAETEPAAMLELAECVREQALRLAVAAGLAHSGELPGWATRVGESQGGGAGGDSIARYAVALAQRAGSGGDAAQEGATAPLTAPLSLSFTKLDSYIRCPRCFYLSERFGLREPPGANMALGSAAHVALHRYYTEVQRADAEGEPTPGVERLLVLAHGALEDAWPRSLEIPADLWTQLRGQLRTMHASLHDPAAHLLHLERSVRMPYEYRGTHELIAKLDRIDQVGPGRFRIIDYKTGEASKKKLEPSKRDLQLGIYAMALRTLFGGAEDGGEGQEVGGTAEYWVLSTGQVGAIDLRDIDLAAVRRDINKAIDGMLSGNFEPASRCTKGCGDFALD